MPNPPVKIAKIVIGDGTIPDPVVFELAPAVRPPRTYIRLTYGYGS